jgi:uncharacterized membrane protein YphA (DoxX/SURF4 family)
MVFLATLILSIVLAIFFAAVGTPKITGARLMHEVAEHFSLPAMAVRGIGALELAGSAGLLIGLPFAPLGVAAAAGLTLLMAGAVTFHVREHDPAARIAGPALAGLIAAVTIFVRAASG